MRPALPVPVQGARIPSEDLPEDLKPLSRRQAVELRDTRWNECRSGRLHSSYPLGGAEGTPVREWQGEGQCTSLRAVAVCYPAADP